MENIEDIIKIDTKWLLHFLKENHWFIQYYKKQFRIINNDTPKNYKQWITYIISNKYVYAKFLKMSMCYDNDISKENDWKFFLKTNTVLLSSPIIFSVWREQPFTLINSNEMFDEMMEHDKWKNVTKNYALLKKILYQINAYEKY